MINRRIAQFAYIAVLIVGIAVYKRFSPEIQANLLAVGDTGGWAGLLPHVIGAATLFTAFAASVFFSIPPGPVFYIVFGYCYGPYEGTILADLATTLGSVGAFWFFRNAMSQRRSRKNLDVKNVFLTLLLLRSSPWIPNPLITVFCSAFDVGIVTFTLTTFFGTLPLIVCYTLAASRLHGHLDVSLLYSPELALAFGLLSVVSLLGLLKPLRIILAYLKAIQAEAAIGIDSAGVPIAGVPIAAVAPCPSAELEDETDGPGGNTRLPVTDPA